MSINELANDLAKTLYAVTPHAIDDNGEFTVPLGATLETIAIWLLKDPTDINRAAVAEHCANFMSNE